MPNNHLPLHGHNWEKVKAEMEVAQKNDSPWYNEHMFIGGSYFGGEDVVEVANEAYQMYINYNALYATKVFPSLVRYETDIVGALLEMMNAPMGASGSITTGGTESLIMAVKTAHAWAHDHRPGATPAEIVVPHAAHPAFDKTAHLMGIKAVRMTQSPDFRADIKAMERAINDNTIMLTASAPSYPFGVTDSISEIATLAERHGLWLHVDACHGGFIFPFARTLGYSIPDYDFAVPGVTSISVDVHKLGYANKGVSALLLHDASLETYQRYTFEDWPSGVYSTQNLMGSRSGGGLASAWAVLNYLGEAGYLERVGKILDTREQFLDGIRRINGLEIWGEPEAYLIAFGSNAFDIFAVDEGMVERGWLSSRLLDPPAIHLFLDMSHTSIVAGYLHDLTEVVNAVKSGKIQSREKGALYSR
ncbi:aspartate aminotransferase family protein [Candidatus Poribacteria bacterium]|nr:aspartate aminotransferase family protein [Candidatus Poribacteria bacterium]